MLGLLPLFQWINLFLHCFQKKKQKKNCTTLNQSEWKFFSFVLLGIKTRVKFIEFTSPSIRSDEGLTLE